MRKRAVFSITAGCFGLIASLLVIESALRLMGFEVWIYSEAYPNEPMMHEPDPVLGWTNKPGEYVYPAYARIPAPT